MEKTKKPSRFIDLEGFITIHAYISCYIALGAYKALYAGFTTIFQQSAFYGKAYARLEDVGMRSCYRLF